MLKKILVCEDDRLMQRALDILLGKEGFEIEHAFDGNEAFELIKSKAYDVIIVDIHLPYSSGLEIIECLRNELKKNTPVIVVTAISDKQIQNQAASLGIDKYILKPYDPKELVKTISDTIKIRYNK
jgi:DNA-binding response OmpR family regulator